MPNVKTEEELKLMRKSCEILAEILHTLAREVRVGMTTGEINARAEGLIGKKNVMSNFKGYRGFPGVCCTSVNEEIVHSIPGKRVLKDGDIISIDCGVIYKGFHSDSAVTVLVGNVAPRTRQFVYDVQRAFDKAVSVIGPGVYTGDIGYVIQRFVESKGYSVVRDFIGHGIGRKMHEEPQIPNFGKKGKGTLLVPGMTIAVEPIIAMGARFADILSDKWTAVTRDKSLACQIEHTIEITPAGCNVLTKYNNTTNNIYPQ